MIKLFIPKIKQRYSDKAPVKACMKTHWLSAMARASKTEADENLIIETG